MELIGLNLLTSSREVNLRHRPRRVLARNGGTDPNQTQTQRTLAQWVTNTADSNTTTIPTRTRAEVFRQDTPHLEALCNCIIAGRAPLFVSIPLEVKGLTTGEKLPQPAGMEMNLFKEQQPC